MSVKKIFLLAGTALLVAACNSGITAPVGKVRGGAASHAKAAADSTKTVTPPAATNSSMDDCYANFPVTSGLYDTTCTQPNP